MEREGDTARGFITPGLVCCARGSCKRSRVAAVSRPILTQEKTMEAGRIKATWEGYRFELPILKDADDMLTVDAGDVEAPTVPAGRRAEFEAWLAGKVDALAADMRRGMH